MQVVGAVDPGVGVRLLGLEEAHRDPGGDAELAGHHRHRRGELFAVAGAATFALGEEPHEVVAAVAEVDVGAVSKTPVAEPCWIATAFS